MERQNEILEIIKKLEKKEIVMNKKELNIVIDEYSINYEKLYKEKKNKMIQTNDVNEAITIFKELYIEECNCGEEKNRLSSSYCTDCEEIFKAESELQREKDLRAEREEQSGVKIYKYEEIIEMINEEINRITEEIEEVLDEKKIKYEKKVVEPEDQGIIIKFIFKGEKYDILYLGSTFTGTAGEHIECILRLKKDETIIIERYFNIVNGEYEVIPEGAIAIQENEFNKEGIEEFIYEIDSFIEERA